MDYKESVFDRMEQSFILLLKTKDFLLALSFLYLWMYILDVFLLKTSIWNIKLIWNTYINANNYIQILLYFIYLLFKGFVFIIVMISSIKYIDNFLNNEANKVDIIDYFVYWISNLWNSLYVYYYVFMYVYLIPLLVLVFWMLFILYWLYINESINFFLSTDKQTWIFIKTWLTISIISTFLIIFFGIYRWIKTTFSFYQAVSYDDYWKNNFNKAVLLTNWFWWRILWNVMIISFMVWFIISIISWVSKVFDLLLWTAPSISKESFGNDIFNVENIKNILQNNVIRFSASWVIMSIIKWIWTFYMIIFIHIFYKRLIYENKNDLKVDKNILSSDNL